MTDRDHAQPPDSQQPSWPLAEASQRHPAGGPEPSPDRPDAARYPGFAGPHPPGSGPYAQPPSAFQRPGQAYGYQGATYGPPGYQPGSGFGPTGPLGLPTPGASGPRRRAGTRIAIAAGVVGLMLSSGILGGVAATRLDYDGATPVAATRTPTVAATQTGALADVVAAVSPSVVSINVAVRGGSGTGSGVIIDSDGTILTNAHVVASATRIQVLLADGRRVDARLLGADTDRDVALIQVQNAGTLTPASIATGGALRVGDTVLAFGSPLGLQGSVTAGIVSSVDRQVEGRSSTLSGMIQTDAAINPGNSGGPLVNTAGQVVGMNTAIATTGDGGGNIGVGFAIPIDKAMQVAGGLRSR
jgi:putative serine protease PepD